MSIHSILPPEAFFSSELLPTAELRQCCYGPLECTRNPQGSFTIRRIISTDPAAYLDARYAPGMVLQHPDQTN